MSPPPKLNVIVSPSRAFIKASRNEPGPLSFVLLTGDSRIERRSQRARAQDQVRQISRYNLIRSNIWMHNAANLAVKVNSDGGNRSAHVRRRRGRGAKVQVYCRDEHWIGGNGIGIL